MFFHSCGLFALMPSRVTATFASQLLLSSAFSEGRRIREDVRLGGSAMALDNTVGYR